ncbi:DNA repair protein RecO [Granulicella sp. 5B5]|uniref:DNA repair protein RecO n=1 Tax=Granulicella sp. 5B5 TaxID=1617967 RepID=UPI0015F5314B|nr:DNA repair protein RecO [Granulicella sp. 5B5]QMV19583.1 DNA repair protein RecO [Granulicella sp. 5B5]
MAEGRQIPHHGEAIVLRTWPFHEADLLVSLFTRDQGKVKGVARHAMRSRRRFGGALEPATRVLAHYTERPKQELVRLDSFEILWSPLSAPIDTLRLAALQLVTEVLEEAMPDLAPEDNLYRLAVTTLAAIQAGCPTSGLSDVGSQSASQSPQIYLPVTYFALWMNRLMGWMPELGHCAACGLDLKGQTVYWSPLADGVTCHDDRRPQSRPLSAASVAESHRIARTPLAELATEDWPATRAADLRAFAIGTLERHLERRLRSAAFLSI